jgi:hypothetical protein
MSSRFAFLNRPTRLEARALQKLAGLETYCHSRIRGESFHRRCFAVSLLLVAALASGTGLLLSQKSSFQVPAFLHISLTSFLPPYIPSFLHIPSVLHMSLPAFFLSSFLSSFRNSGSQFCSLPLSPHQNTTTLTERLPRHSPLISTVKPIFCHDIQEANEVCQKRFAIVMPKLTNFQEEFWGKSATTSLRCKFRERITYLPSLLCPSLTLTPRQHTHTLSLLPPAGPKATQMNLASLALALAWLLIWLFFSPHRHARQGAALDQTR